MFCQIQGSVWLVTGKFKLRPCSDPHAQKNNKLHQAMFGAEETCKSRISIRRVRGQRLCMDLKLLSRLSSQMIQQTIRKRSQEKEIYTIVAATIRNVWVQHRTVVN